MFTNINIAFQATGLIIIMAGVLVMMHAEFKLKEACTATAPRLSRMQQPSE